MTQPTAFIDDRTAIANLDKSNMLGSIEALADQVRQAWQDVNKVTFSKKADIHHVVVAGMGGSALGADVAKHLFKDSLTAPLDIINGYHLPAYVNEHTLVILSSYSGSTEETLSCAVEAKAKQAQIMVIAAGSKLVELAKQENYPVYVINPEFNPSNQPRMAIGYAITGLLGLLSKAGVCNLTDAEVDEVIAAIIQTNDVCNVSIPQSRNQSKLLAFTALDRRPILVASDFLVGAVHTAANQFNENAKAFADYKVIPELNHHLMEGLKFPSSNASTHVFVLIQSDLYDDRIKKRLELTRQVIEQNGIETITINVTADSKLTQAFELITILAYATFYLSMLENIDPSPIPFVDWFKEELAK